MNEPYPQTLNLSITDLQAFAAQLRYDVEYVLQPALDGVNADLGAVMLGERPNQALGNHKLNPAAQWIGAGIELNIRGVADHLARLIESMRFMAELSEAIAAEHQTIDEQNAMDVARFGEFAGRAKAAVEGYQAAQLAAFTGAEEQA